MENKENKQENIGASTRMDTDGNLQIRSSGKSTPAVPRKLPEKQTSAGKGGAKKEPCNRKSTRAVNIPVAGQKSPRRTPAVQSVQRRPAVKAQPPRKSTPVHNDGVEYSFANSQLFNNGNAKIDATAASAARTAQTDGISNMPSDGHTRIMPAQNPAAGGAPRNHAARAGSAVRTDNGKGPNGLQKPRPVRAQKPEANGEGVVPRDAAVQPARKPSYATKVTPAVKADARIRPSKKALDTMSAMNSVSRAFIYIAAVLIISIIFSAVIITNANDIFAFVKSEEMYSITIEAGTDLNQLADQLKEMGIIKHKLTFKMYTKYRKNDSDAYIAGTYTVSPSMNYDQLIRAITPTVERETIAITIPEGFTVEDIIELFVSKGMGTKEGFVDVIQNYNFDYWFVNELPENSERYYRLEGYLFPDTYYFYTNAEEVDIINKFLDNFDKKYTQEYKDRAKALGYTTDQLITLASIIQGEGKEKIISIENGDEHASYVDYGLISSVFHNRMSIGMKLQSDATTLFALKMDKTGQDKVTGSNKNYNNPYNTYNIDKLPPGAICNPGQNAISFALWPDSSPYYYFVSDSEGVTHFAVTLEEHNALAAQYLQE